MTAAIHKKAIPEKQSFCHHLLSPALTPVIPSTNHLILLKYDVFTTETQCRSKTKSNVCCCSENLLGNCPGKQQSRIEINFSVCSVLQSH